MASFAQQMRGMPYFQNGMIVLLCVVLGGCSKKTVETEPAPASPVPIAVATPQPAIPARATPVPATPVAKRLAPDGTYFLLVKKSAETADGVLGFKPGAMVRKGADGSYTAEGHKLDVKANEITNDLDLAASYAGADAQRQAALRQAAAATTPPPSSQASTSTRASSSSSSSSPSASSGLDMISATKRTASGLESSSTLGAGHTKNQDGWLWQKNAAGDWKRVKPLR